MQKLLDSCVAALLVSDCRDSDPIHRFQRAASRVEELLRSLGFPLIASELCRYRSDCGPMPANPPPHGLRVAAATLPPPPEGEQPPPPPPPKRQAKQKQSVAEELDF